MEPNFTLVQLRYFAAAAEHGSMTAASRALRVSQSAVSTAVSQLENELGVQLFLRHHARGLTLTAAGESFQREVRVFLIHGSELAESARREGSTLVGDLRIGCFATLAPFDLPGLLLEFEQTYPEVEVSVIEEEHAALKQALRAGACEISLMYGYDLDEDIDSVVMRTAPPYVLVPVGHPLAGAGTVHLADLIEEPMVLLDLPHTAHYFESMVASVGLLPRIRHRSSGYETVRAMVASGHGWAVLNQRPMHDLTYDGGRIVILELADEVQPVEVVLASMRGARLTSRAQAFVRAARRRERRTRD